MTASVETIPAIYKNSIVVFKDKTYRVTRVNAKSLSVKDVDGKDWKLTMPSGSAWRSVREATPEESAAFRTQEFAEQTQADRVMRVGNVVVWPGATHKLAKDRLLIVTKVNAEGAANLVPLGGTVTGEYFRSVPARLLEKVTADHMVTVNNA